MCFIQPEQTSLTPIPSPEPQLSPDRVVWCHVRHHITHSHFRKGSLGVISLPAGPSVAWDFCRGPRLENSQPLLAPPFVGRLKGSAPRKRGKVSLLCAKGVGVPNPHTRFCFNSKAMLALASGTIALGRSPILVDSPETGRQRDLKKEPMLPSLAPGLTAELL